MTQTLWWSTSVHAAHAQNTYARYSIWPNTWSHTGSAQILHCHVYHEDTPLIIPQFNNRFHIKYLGNSISWHSRTLTSKDYETQSSVRALNFINFTYHYFQHHLSIYWFKTSIAIMFDVSEKILIQPAWYRLG